MPEHLVSLTRVRWDWLEQIGEGGGYAEHVRLNSLFFRNEDIQVIYETT